MNSHKQLCSSNYPAEIDLAKRELFAFIGAVTRLFGPEEAKLAAEDWLDKLELMDSSSESTSRNWRAVTIAASARLASRLAVTQRKSDCSISAGIHQLLTREAEERRTG